MKNFLSSLLATIVGIILISTIMLLVFVGIVASSTSKDAPDVKENSLLVAKFNAPILDRTDDNPFTKLMSGNPYGPDPMGLDQILKDLDKAEKDENIKGIMLNLSVVNARMATLYRNQGCFARFQRKRQVHLCLC